MIAFRQNLIPALWLIWAAYWLISSYDVKADRRQESRLQRLSHIVPLAVAAWMIWAPSLPGGFLGGRFIAGGSATFFAGAAIVAFGLGFAVWARRRLGRNWSGVVTVKEGHELVRSGPYRFVRHPIYTGLLLAFLGSAIARGEWRGLVAVAIVFVAFWTKLKREERWMIETFGDAYLRYRDEVAALIPFVL